MVRKTNKGRKFRKYNKRRAARVYARRKKAIYATPRMVYKISLQTIASILTIPGGSTLKYEFEPSLSDVVSNDLTAFENLYDEFRITGFTWKLVPMGNVANTNFTSDVLGSAVYDNIGLLYYSVLDHTDVVPLTSSDQALEYRNCKTHRSWRTNKRYCPATVPRLTKDVNNNPLLVTQKPSWMQIKSQTIGGTTYDNKEVAHIGCKLYFEENLNATDLELNLFITLHCEFRNKN